MYIQTEPKAVLDRVLENTLYDSTHALLLYLEGEGLDPMLLTDPYLKHGDESGVDHYDNDFRAVDDCIASGPYTHVTLYQQVSVDSHPSMTMHDGRVYSEPVHWGVKRLDKRAFDRWTACFESGDLCEINDPLFYLVLTRLLGHDLYHLTTDTTDRFVFSINDLEDAVADLMKKPDGETLRVARYTELHDYATHVTPVRVTPVVTYMFQEEHPVYD